MTLMSIIIPIYNIEDYLKQCIDSVLDQGLVDLEVILIDDGSTDGSLLICEEYAKMDHRISVIHKDNNGQAAARNDGLKLATGKYVVFLDGDDYWMPQVLQDIVKKTIDKADLDLDMVLFDYSCCSSSKIMPISSGEHDLTIFNDDIYDGKQLLNKLLLKNPNFNWYPFLYLIKRDLLLSNNLFFEHGIVYEDVNWVYKVILKCESIMVIQDVLYSYRILRLGSTSNTYKYTTEYMKLNVVDNNIRWIENNIKDNELKNLLCNNLSCIFYSTLILYYHIDKINRNDMYKKINETIWVCRYTTSLQQKIIRYMLKLLGVKITCRILYIRSKLKNY